MGRREMGIPICHGDGAMPHQVFHRRQVNARYHQTAGKSMSQAVPLEIPDPGLRDRALEPMAITL
jgi:hypothetical protein